MARVSKGKAGPCTGAVCHPGRCHRHYVSVSRYYQPRPTDLIHILPRIQCHPALLLLILPQAHATPCPCPPPCSGTRTCCVCLWALTSAFHSGARSSLPSFQWLLLTLDSHSAHFPWHLFGIYCTVLCPCYKYSLSSQGDEKPPALHFLPTIGAL